MNSDSVRIVIRRGDTFLVLTESDDVDNWKLPGGKFSNENESPEEAARRELLEELGLSSENGELEFRARLVNDDGVSARYIYSLSLIGDVFPSDEIAKTLWVTKSEVPEGKNQGHILSAESA